DLIILFSITLPSPADNSPVYLSGVVTPTGTRDVLFLATTNGHVMAIDAESGSRIWSKLYPAGNCLFESGFPCYSPSAPVIDPSRQFVYAYGLDGYVHKYKVGSGLEVVGNGWPELITTKGTVEKESSNLAVATARNGTSYLYAVTSSEDDFGD